MVFKHRGLALKHLTTALEKPTMFSNHLPKINQLPTRTLLIIGAGVVIVGQLIAMVTVANGQVEKAQLREISQASARAAAVWCIESSRGEALRQCDRAPSSASASFSAQMTGDQAPSASRDINFVTISSRY